MIDAIKSRGWLRTMVDAFVIGWHMAIVDYENRNPQLREWNNAIRRRASARLRTRTHLRGRCDVSSEFIGTGGHCGRCTSHYPCPVMPGST